MAMGKSFFILMIVFLIRQNSFGQIVPGSHAAIKKSVLIFSPQSEHAHGSSLVELSNGDMLTAWFQGSGERKADDVRIMGARLRKGETSWSQPFIMADTYQLPDCNPVLFLNNKGTLFLTWIAVVANKWENSVLVYKTSEDYLKSGPPAWNSQNNIFLKPTDDFLDEVKKKMKDLPDNTSGWSAYAPRYEEMIIEASADITKRSMGWMTRIHPLILKEGKILLPLYSDGFNFSLVAISEDDGLTWRPSLPMVGRGNVQPSLVPKKNGDIVAYMRDNGDAPARVQISSSSDQGETWTAAQKTDIPNTASVQVIVLKNGQWVFIGNVLDNGRNQLSLWISKDEGATWKATMFLENEALGKGSFSYPSMLQGRDGLLHITYSHQLEDKLESIKYVVVNPDLVK